MTILQQQRRLSFTMTTRLRLFLLIACLSTTHALIGRLQNDFAALTRRATAYHILLPADEDLALLVKQKIRNAAQDRYVVDVFCDAATKYSRDGDTAMQGGLLATSTAPTPQGYVRCAPLDEARFSVPLGVVSGPIPSEHGLHLVLVTERTNCPKLDGSCTKIARGPDGLAQPETTNATTPWMQVLAWQVAFWTIVTVLGGMLAEGVAALTAI